MSTYLTETDWQPYLRNNAISMITSENPALLDVVEETAISIIRDHLEPRYDMAGEFSKTGTERKAHLVWWVISLALYHLYQRIPDKLVPDRIIKNYDETRADLSLIADGRRETNLTTVQRADGSVATKFRYGGFAPRSEG